MISDEEYNKKVRMINMLREHLRKNPEDIPLKKKIDELENKLFSEEINRNKSAYEKINAYYGIEIINDEED